VEGNGSVFLSGLIFITAGVMRFFDAWWTFRYNGAVPQNLQDALFGHNLNTYGWIYLVVAAVLIGGGFLVIRGSEFGRWIGVAAASLAAISAIWWMPYYPVWAVTYIAAGAFVVYVLVARGGKEVV